MSKEGEKGREGELEGRKGQKEKRDEPMTHSIRVSLMRERYRGGDVQR